MLSNIFLSFSFLILDLVNPIDSFIVSSLNLFIGIHSSSGILFQTHRHTHTHTHKHTPTHTHTLSPSHSPTHTDEKALGRHRIFMTNCDAATPTSHFHHPSTLHQATRNLWISPPALSMLFYLRKKQTNQNHTQHINQTSWQPAFSLVSTMED